MGMHAQWNIIMSKFVYHLIQPVSFTSKASIGSHKFLTVLFYICNEHPGLRTEISSNRKL